MEDNFSKFLFEYNKLETSLNKISGAPVDANMKWYEDNYTDQKIKNKLYGVLYEEKNMYPVQTAGD